MSKYDCAFDAFVVTLILVIITAFSGLGPEPFQCVMLYFIVWVTMRVEALGNEVRKGRKDD